MNNGKLKRYLKYGIGEILLIVAGILIALAINNKNSDLRKDKKFNNGLSQLYTNLYCEIGFNEQLIDQLENKVEIALVELDEADTINGWEIPSRMNDLNSNPLQYSSNSANVINQLQENIVSEEQNVLMNHISSYYAIYEKWDLLIEGDKVRFLDELFKKHGLSQPSQFGYNEYTEEDIAKAIRIRNDPNYKTQLQSIINNSYDLIHAIDYKINESRAILEYILDRKNPPNLNFKHIGILGTALPSGWEQSVAMDLIDKEKAIWNIQIELQDGTIKFREGNSWNQNWGATNSNNGNIMFFGRNIPVQKGFYEITLNLQDKKYTIQEITGANTQ